MTDFDPWEDDGNPSLPGPSHDPMRSTVVSSAPEDPWGDDPWEDTPSGIPDGPPFTDVEDPWGDDEQLPAPVANRDDDPWTDDAGTTIPALSHDPIPVDVDAMFEPTSRDEPAGAEPAVEDSLNVWASGLLTAEVDHSRRNKLIALLVAVLLVVVGAGAYLLLRPTPVPPFELVDVSQPTEVTRSGTLPGHTDELWSVTVPDDDIFAGTSMGLVTIEQITFNLYDAHTGEKVMSHELADPVDFVTTATSVEGQPTLMWQSGGQLWWWNAKQGDVASTPFPEGGNLSTAGTGPLVTLDGSVRALLDGELVEVPVPAGDIALGVVNEDVLSVSGSQLHLTSISEQVSRTVELVAPNHSDTNIVRWVGIGRELVVTAWSRNMYPSGDDLVVVAVHNMAGELVSQLVMNADTALETKWERTSGGLVGTLRTAAFNMSDGTILMDCSDCQAAGGFGMFPKVSTSTDHGFWADGKLVVTPVTPSSANLDGTVILVTEGQTVTAYGTE